MLSSHLSGNDPILNIEGDLVALGPLDRDLLPLHQRWLNDFSHARNFNDTPEPWTMDRARALVQARADPAGDAVFFTIYERGLLQPIGYTMLVDISFWHRSAEFAIHIGEDTAHGKGYGTETTWMMLDYAFALLGLHSVYLSVAEYNQAGRRAYQRAGFRETGRFREAWLMGGRFWDVIIMDCLAGEFTEMTRASAP